MKARHLALAPLLAGIALTATLAVTPARAQPTDPNYDSSQDDPAWAQRQDAYQRQQEQYRDAQSAYDAQKDVYYDRRDSYEHQRARFNRERDAYDARHGAGAYHRYWRHRADEYDDRYGPGAYDRDFDGPR